jgi:hypothetical protein
MKTNHTLILTNEERTLLKEVNAELGKKATSLLESANQNLSKDGYKLIKEILIETMRALPSDDELTTPMDRLDRLAWTADMIELMKLLDNVIFLELGCTTAHNLEEIGGISGVTAEAIRQTEMSAVRKVHKNNTLEELEDFKKAITDWSAVKHEQSLDFSQHTPPAMTKQDHVEIDQAYQRTKYKSA